MSLQNQNSRNIPRRKHARIIAAAATASLIMFLTACAGGGAISPILIDVPVGEEFEDATSTGFDDGIEIIEEEIELSEAELLAKRVLYFDYDSSLLSALGEAVSGAHARYLLGNLEVKIILEGHADERGTREYNLALAEDRAHTVADVLQALGVESDRIEIVSYGEERPVVPGHDEEAWKLNRRVEILYQ